ncbi:TadE/TadG family type IV pilus assembly protein, partial [Variovorax beijingensis]|uniref:TadE/TadG family type IV pilus assembly protein n=1 Tax=Variovorax beijingensis TaxID=2496117 RepID=UPI003F6A3E34
MKRTSNRRQRGVALVELALITPLLLLLTFITTEFGRAMYEYNLVVKSTRDAVRYL